MATSTIKLPYQLVRERYTSDSFTVNANQGGSKTINIEKSGYTPIGVVGLWALKNTSSVYYNFRLGDASGNGNSVVNVGVKNNTGAAIDGQFAVDILYVKN